ncbi:MAG TPA: hypothetical protein VMI54_03525, partial [Polyangiaceae bacterium]|nr:hypothetical protein [Polyangiaceae bacterium]
PTGPAPLLDSTPTAPRTTAQPTRPFQTMMNAGAGAVVSGAEAAVTKLPGGAVLAAAIRPTNPTLSFPGASPGGAASPAPQTPEGYPASTSATPGAPTGTADPSMESLLSQDANQNLYYIALQERMSAENRFYTAYSNVLRVRHDSMKNAIGNLR